MKNIVFIDEKDLFSSELDVREFKSFIGKEDGDWFWLPIHAQYVISFMLQTSELVNFKICKSFLSRELVNFKICKSFLSRKESDP